MKKCVDLTKNEGAACTTTIKNDKLFWGGLRRRRRRPGPPRQQVPAVGEMRTTTRVLDEINFMGPKAGWGTFKETADSLGGVYWDVDSSFSKFKMPSFKLGPFSF